MMTFDDALSLAEQRTRSMAITFTCDCGKTLRAGDQLAGKKTRCPQCSSVLTIPPAEADSAPVDPELVDPSSYLQDEMLLRPMSTSAFSPILEDEKPSMRHESPSAQSSASRGVVAKKPKPEAEVESSLLEYTYLLLAFALIPLLFSLLSKDSPSNLQERFVKSIAQAPPEEQKRIESVLARGDISLDEALAVLPGGRLDGAHLARDTSVHWVYATIAAVGFLLLLGLFFSVERASPMHLLGIGAFTGTVGIIFLLAVQFCSNFRLGRIHGRGVVMLFLLILAFIGWSYNSANDPDSNFFLSALGFTFGVGLCEEFTKAIPLFFYFKRQAEMGWRGACLWGLASGIGFGVSEGIMYSSRYYNGFSGIDIYLVRFVSCVALHAMWSASVGIAIARNVDDYEKVEDSAGFGLFMLRMLAVPMVLHGFYDTLLKKDMNLWALGVALLSFAWFAWHIELARGSHPGRGRPRVARGKMAY
jgi:RsiW-degrading membrane proteinase PrsW (M82 family)